METKSSRSLFGKKYRLAIAVIAILLLIAGIAIAGIASYSLSLNSPASFPVDI